MTDINNNLQTPKGAPSIKVGPGHTFKRHMRIERAVRLELAGLSIYDIAAHLGITVPGLTYVRQSSYYKAKRQELLTGVISEYDRIVREDTESLRGELKQMLPTALLTLRNAIVAGNAIGASHVEKKLAFEASKEVMDREGTIAKVSRTSISVNDDVIDPAQHEAINVDLLSILNAANDAKKSGDTSKLEVFVAAAGSKETQEQMAANINLKDFNSPTVQ